MSIINRERYPHAVFFSQSDFLEIGTRSDGAKIIQIGTEGDAPLVAFANMDAPAFEDLHALELWSLMKFSQDPNEYQFYEQPKKLNQNLRVIHKYKLPSGEKFSLNLPVDAEILTVQLQNNTPYLWALLDPRAPQHSRDFLWIRTGDEVTYKSMNYIATLQFENGQKVCHLFELNVDYSKLENLLALEQWREADLETFKILERLCGIDGSPDGRRIYQKGISNISCSDLQTINQLWTRYSNGHFGYSTQRSIEQEIKNYWRNLPRDRDFWNRFCTRLGWTTTFADLNFSLEAPRGHLPAIVGWGMAWGPIMFEDTHQILLTRLSACENCS